jgi:hypothetical protein
LNLYDILELLTMKQLIDLFTPREVLHMVGIANRMKVLTTEEKKYLLAVRMGAKKDADTESWDISCSEKEKFYPVFSRFIPLVPFDYECVRESCPICSRFLKLKKDFEGSRTSEEYDLLMRWVSRGQTHYTGPSDNATERFSSDFIDEEGKKKAENAKAIEPEAARTVRSAVRKVKRIKVVARKPHLDRSEPKEAVPQHPLIDAVRELSRIPTESLDHEDLREYSRRSRELFSELLALWERFSKAGSDYRGWNSVPREEKGSSGL